MMNGKQGDTLSEPQSNSFGSLGAPQVQGGGTERAKMRPPASVEELITLAYDGKGRRLSLKNRDVDEIAKNIAISEGCFSHLQQIFASDVGLHVALELILLCRRFRDRPSVRAVLREFVARALGAHPIFASSPALLAAIRNLPDAPKARAAYELIAAPPRTTERPGRDLAKQSNGPRRAPVAAIACLAAWMQETRDYPLEMMVRDLHATLWDTAAKRLKDEAARTRALVGRPSFEGFGLLGQVLVDAANHQLHIAEVARRGEAQASTRADSLTAEVATLRAELADREARISTLEHELSATRARHDVEKSHATDDYERLRARFVRLLRDEGRLLEEGLHALRRDPPKTEVMEDHGERVLESLRSMLQQLEEGK